MEAPLAHVILAYREPELRAKAAQALGALPVAVTHATPEAALLKMEALFEQDPGSTVVLVQDPSDVRRKAALRAGAFQVHDGPVTEARMKSLLREVKNESDPFY